MPPPLLPDDPSSLPPTAIELSLGQTRAMTAPAERAKTMSTASAAGVCDYPGAYLPCLCIEPTVATRGGCDSAEEYLDDVQQFGAPRFPVTLSR